MRYLITALLFCFSASLLLGQPTKERAKELMANAKYSDALSLLTAGSTFQSGNKDEETRLLTAVCHYHLNNLNEAEKWLTQLIDDEKYPFPESWLYLGRVYHHRNQFAEAATYYKNFLRGVGRSNAQRPLVVDAIKRCANGLALQYQKNLAFVENLGRNINTQQDEFAPVVSPNNPERLYFSSVRTGNMGGLRDTYGRPDEQLGKYASDMFSCTNEKGLWGQLKSMHFLLNSPQHEMLLGFNPDGSVLYYFKGPTFNEGRILMDTFQQVEMRTLRSDPFLGPVDPRYDDNSVHFVNDTLIYFASSRPGGFGGLDLYKSTFAYGRWSKPENLGPDINTPYDETTPHLALNGRTLYYSTNHPETSIGGLDVVKSTYLPDRNRWTKTFNIGLPINSAGDDAFFRLAKDGFTGYFSSSRKDGYGQRDLYAAYFEDFLPEQEMVFVYEPPVVPQEPEEIIEPTEEPETIVPPPAPAPPAYVLYSNTSFQSPDATVLGRVQAVLDQFPASKLIISSYFGEEALENNLFEGIQQAESIAQRFLDAGIGEDRVFLRSLPAGADAPDGPRRAIEFSFYSEESIPFPTLGRDQSVIAPDHPLNQGLFYKVQFVSVKRKYQNPAIEVDATPMIELSPSVGYYRYTLGAFSTYTEAERYRRTVAKKGFKSAFIIPYVYGMRISSKEARTLSTSFPDLKKYLNR